MDKSDVSCSDSNSVLIKRSAFTHSVVAKVVANNSYYSSKSIPRCTYMPWVQYFLEPSLE